MLEIRGVSFAYRRREILAGVDLSIEPGNSLALMGQTGSGKSTLLAIATGLLRPGAGSVMVLGERVDRLSRAASADLRRRHIGVVFQAGELLPAMTAVENVALPAMLDGASWQEASSRAVELLESLGVEVLDTPAATLSGGERQRVATARALVNEPDLVIADEPTGSLDAQTRDAVAEIIFDLPARTGCALLVVTHDPAIAAHADHSLQLIEGKIHLEREGAAS